MAKKKYIYDENLTKEERNRIKNVMKALEQELFGGVK